MPLEVLGDPTGKPYSPGRRAGNTIFVSGQLGLDAEGKLVFGGIVPETKQTLENLKQVLASGGASMEDVVMVNIYLTELDYDFTMMNQVYLEYFSGNLPARATVEVRKLAFDARVEISAIAVVK